MTHDAISCIHDPSRPAFRTIVSESAVESVLLVEGDPTLRGELGQALRDHSFHVVEAVDGGSALKLLRAMKGTLEWLITNVRLTSLSGLHVAFEYRFLHPTRPIVFIDGSNRQGDGGRDLLSGSVTLRPPFSTHDLMPLMKTLRDHRNGLSTIGF